MTAPCPNASKSSFAPPLPAKPRFSLARRHEQRRRHSGRLFHGRVLPWYGGPSRPAAPPPHGAEGRDYAFAFNTNGSRARDYAIFFVLDAVVSDIDDPRQCSRGRAGTLITISIYTCETSIYTCETRSSWQGNHRCQRPMRRMYGG